VGLVLLVAIPLNFLAATARYQKDVPPGGGRIEFMGFKDSFRVTADLLRFFPPEAHSRSLQLHQQMMVLRLNGEIARRSQKQVWYIIDAADVF
jgi:hypothetical protein